MRVCLSSGSLNKTLRIQGALANLKNPEEHENPEDLGDLGILNIILAELGNPGNLGELANFGESRGAREFWGFSGIVEIPGLSGNFDIAVDLG